MYTLRSLAVIMDDEQIIEALTDGVMGKLAAKANENWPQVTLITEFNQVLEDEFNGRVALESGRDIGQSIGRLIRAGKMI